MFDKSKFQIFRLPRLDLVQRLRLVFALIVAVIGIAFALALMQFKALDKAQSNLLKTSVPVLIRTQVFEHALYDLAIVLGKIEKAQNINALMPISQRVDDQFVRARQSLSGLGHTEEDRELIAQILGQLAKIEDGAQAILLMKRTQFRTEDRLDHLVLDLGQKRLEIRMLVEQLSFDLAQSMDKAVIESFAAGAGGSEAAIAMLREETRKVGLATQLAMELETFANVVDQLGKQISREKLNKTRDFLAFSMRGGLQLLIHLPPSAIRTELSLKTSELRQIVLGDQGILSQIEEFSARARDLAAQNAVEQIMVRDITAATERLVVMAHGQLTQAGKVTQISTRQLIIILSIAATSVASIIAVAILVIVERQINRRLAVLTNSVSRIASGDTDHITLVSGMDELGRMADALGTFKNNARELIRSNAELEKFAYAASHDLRSPLQAIHDLAKWTVEDEANSLSSESAENLGLLQRRVDRLSALLNDLLQYARVGTDMPEASPVDLDTLISNSAAMVDPSGAFEITHIWDGGIIDTYEYPLQKVLLNLMGNTIKHHDLQTGNIRVVSVIKNDRLWVEYSDDGTGIPPEYHGKVFELFQTLRPRDEMEGSGLGLAITKKLVECFGGTVSISSDPATAPGTTFTFDFPIRHFEDTALAA